MEMEPPQRWVVLVLLLLLLLIPLVQSRTKQSKSYKVHTSPTPTVEESSVRDLPNFTPYVTGSASATKPYEPYYYDPVYDMRDLDEDGAPDNPGSVLYRVPVRTGQKDNYNLGVGILYDMVTPPIRSCRINVRKQHKLKLN
jgi:hypothetical protein